MSFLGPLNALKTAMAAVVDAGVAEKGVIINKRGSFLCYFYYNISILSVVILGA